MKLWLWLGIPAAVLASVVVTYVGVAAYLDWQWFGQDEGPVTSCDKGFSQTDWKGEMKATGRAIAECDWFDGKPIAQVVRELGEPDDGPYRGWRTWQIGNSPNGIGPAAWFLSLRAKDGIVTESDAEVRPT